MISAGTGSPSAQKIYAYRPGAAASLIRRRQDPARVAEVVEGAAVGHCLGADTARPTQNRGIERDNTPRSSANLVRLSLLVVLDLPVVPPDHTEQISPGVTFEDRMDMCPFSIHGAFDSATTGTASDQRTQIGGSPQTR
jgi:hypothetical protein